MDDKITASPLFWPDNVARTAPNKRGKPQFEQRTIATAASFIVAEINRLNKHRWDHNDENIIISTNLKLKLDGLPYSQQNPPSDSGVAVYFQLRFWTNGKEHSRPCVLTCDKWQKIEDNLWAIGKDIEAQRARERWGSTTTEQAFRGYLAIPEKCGGKSWWDMLGIKPDASEQAVKDAYKAKGKTMHPDKGGTQDGWIEIQTAYEQAMAQFRK